MHKMQPVTAAFYLLPGGRTGFLEMLDLDEEENFLSLLSWSSLGIGFGVCLSVRPLVTEQLLEREVFTENMKL